MHSTDGGLEPVSYPIPMLSLHQCTTPAPVYTHYNLLELLIDVSPHPCLPLATSPLCQHPLSPVSLWALEDRHPSSQALLLGWGRALD